MSNSYTKFMLYRDLQDTEDQQQFHTLTSVPAKIQELPVLHSTVIADFPSSDQAFYNGMNMAELWRFSKKGNKNPKEPEARTKEQVKAAIAFMDMHFDKEKICGELIERLLAIRPDKLEGKTITLLAPAGAEQELGENRVATSRNVLPTLHACYIKDALEDAINEHTTLGEAKLKVEINEQFVQLSKSNSTDAGLIGKIVSTPYFAMANEEGEIIEPKGKQDKIALVVEDDTEMGGASLAAQAFASENFTQCIGVAVVATSPGAEKLEMQQETLDALESKLQEKTNNLNNILSETGQSLKSISNIAGIGLVALLSDPHNAQDKAIYSELLKNAGTSLEEIERYEDVRGDGKKHLLTKAFTDTEWCDLSPAHALGRFKENALSALESRTMLSPPVARISYVERIRQEMAKKMTMAEKNDRQSLAR